MNIPRSMIEAGARALCKKAHADNDVWDSIPEDCKRVYAFHSETAIRAAIGCGNWVMCRRPTAMTLSQDGAENFRYDLRDGDTILIVRAEKGGGNG